MKNGWTFKDIPVSGEDEIVDVVKSIYQANGNNEYGNSMYLI